MNTQKQLTAVSISPTGKVRKMITRTTELVHKGSRPTTPAYEPFSPVPAALTKGIRDKYILDSIQSHWTSSEARKREILEIVKENRKALRNVPLSVQHKGKNMTVRNSQEKIKSMIYHIAAINKLIDKAFEPKQKSSYIDIPRNKKQLA